MQRARCLLPAVQVSRSISAEVEHKHRHSYRAAMPSVHTFLVLLILTLHLHAIPPGTGAAAARDDDTLMPGQAFTVGNKLVSSNGKFALGFFQPRAGNMLNKPSSTSPAGWYLGIWFNKIPLVTPVWVANQETPILEPHLNATQLQISEDGNLMIVIVSNNATQSLVIWSTSTHTDVAEANNTPPATCRAILKNTGNLLVVVIEKENPSNSNATPTTTTNSKKLWLWQSFDYPTHALLPHAKIGWDKATGLNRVGISWKSQVDPGLGSFRVGLETNGSSRSNDVTISRRSYPYMTYWRWSPNAAGGVKIPELRALLHMNPLTSGLVVPEYVNSGEEEYYSYTSPDESSATFFSIETNGQVKMNAWSHANQSWYNVFLQPVDPCSPYATCGPKTVCTGSSQPPCQCIMETFSRASPQDWDLGDRTGGCSRNNNTRPLDLDCSADSSSSSTDVFHPIPRVTLPYGPQSLQHTTTRSECERACLGNCSCTAYSYQQDTKCSVWHGKLFNVNQDDGVEISSEDSIYIRVAAADFPSLTRGATRKPLPVGAITTAASVIGSGVLLIVIVMMISRKKCGVSSPSRQASVGVAVFSYAELSRATRNFSDKLGAGGFGSVYKGVIGGGMSTVAVKRLDGVRQGEKQFRAEVSALGLIQHINLVKLVGFCCQGDKRLLVYEHMCNGSLDSHLFQRNENDAAAAVLDWSTRYQIAVGVARGLSYLHSSCREFIIHCDIKPENILLDESFVPKIADFGLASVIGRDFSRVLTTFKGTMGYLAPEWLSGVPITSKVDVYSFGMVLMEIISGTRNASVVDNTTSSSMDEHVTYFPVHAMSQLHEGDVQSLVDPSLHGNFSLEEAERVCKVACWCIQDNESDRPTMGEVVRVFEGLQDLDIPPMPRLLAAITECSSVVAM